MSGKTLSSKEYNKRMTALLQQMPYPSDNKMKKIARQMGKTHLQISRWFSSNRFLHGINVSLILSSRIKNNAKSKRKTNRHEKLIETFAKNPNPSKELRRQLAAELGRSENYISHWFYKAKRKVFVWIEWWKNIWFQNMNQSFIKNEYNPQKENVRKAIYILRI